MDRKATRSSRLRWSSSAVAIFAAASSTWSHDAGAALRALGEEREHALLEQRGRLLVVLGEVVLGAGVDEELRPGHGRRETLRDLVVVVAVQDVQLERHAVGPGLRPVVAPLPERQGRVAEHRAARARPRLG